MAYIDDVVSAVFGVTTDWRERAALLFACGAESGCQPIQNRQGAPAYGPWQIYLPYHPSVTVAIANDPKRAAEYMYSQMGVKACVAQQDWSNPAQATLLAARCIEHASSQEQYSQAQLKQATDIVNKYVAKDYIKSQVDGGGIVGGITDGITGAINDAVAGIGRGVGTSIVNFIKGILSSDMVVRGLLVVIGIVFIISGINGLTHLGDTATKAATTAAVAAA